MNFATYRAISPNIAATRADFTTFILTPIIMGLYLPD